MADVKICDRCGKKIEPGKAQSFGFGAWKYQLFNCNSSYMENYYYDLCISCGKKLSKFLNGEEIDVG